MTATSYDRTVTPYTSAFIDAPNVTNILVQDGCPEDHTGHIAGSTDPNSAGNAEAFPLRAGVNENAMKPKKRTM